MVVAVNLTGFICGSNRELLLKFFIRLAHHRSEDTFIFITDRQQDAFSNLPGNVKLQTSRPLTRHSFLWKPWYNRTLPALVKKSGAAVLIHASGVSSAHCKLQQIVFANEYLLPKLFTGEDKTMQAFFMKNSAAILEQAGYVIVGSLPEKTAIAELYKIPEHKIRIIHPAIDELYAVVDYFNKEATKEEFTEGKEYFLFNGPMNGHESALVNLLKAFSFLKKRQKTNMQLVLIPGSDTDGTSIAVRLKLINTGMK